MDAPENIVPSPWRTLGRTLLKALVALVILGTIWCSWSAYATHRLESQLANYHSRGEPSSYQDFQHTMPPADQNAYDIMMAAFNSLTLSSAEEEVIVPSTGSSLLNLPLSDADMATIRGMLDHSTKTLDLIRKVRTAPANIWPFDPKDPLGSVSSHALGHFRKLGNYCRIIALYYHQNHQDRLAVDEIKDILAISNNFSKHGFLINHLVAVVISAAAAQAVLEIAPSLQLQSVETPVGAPRDAVTDLMREFLDVGQPQNHFLDAMKNERVYVCNEAESPPYHSVILAPALKLDAVRAMEYWTTEIAALEPNIPSYAEFISKTPAVSVSESNLHLITHFLSRSSLAEIALFRMHYQGLMDREAAGLRLAVRMYELDHRGQLPASLMSLVPQYLPQLPIDFFNPKGGSFIYVPNRRLFYSLYQNGTDEGGKWTPGRPSRYWYGDDAVYPLDWSPPVSPPTPPATSPHYDNPDN